MLVEPAEKRQSLKVVLPATIAVIELQGKLLTTQ
jgi:hypothetical protein